MADSSTYTPETLQRRYAMAQALLAPPKEPIRHWAQGLNELAQGALGGYQMGNTERLEAKQRGDANAQVMAALGLGGQTAPAPAMPPAAGPSAAPGPVQTGPAPAPPPQVIGTGGKPLTPDAQGVYDDPNVTMLLAAGGASPPDFGKAIAGIESTGQKDPYAAMGPIIPKTGDRAYGKYQVMGANIPAWTKEHLGQEMTPQQFLANPQAQDAVFKGQFGKYVQQTGNPQDAASLWFTGKPLAQGANLTDRNSNNPNGITGQQYVDKFSAGLPGAGASPAVGAIAAALNGGPSGAPAAGSPPTPDAAPGAVTPPGGAPSPAVAGVAKALGAPGGAPAAAPLAGPAGVGANPNAKAIAAVLTSPWIDPSVKQAVIAQSSPSFGFQTLPDGTIVRTNPKTGQVEPIYSAPVKPELKDTGTDPITGQKTFQEYDPKTHTMKPVGTGAPGDASNVPQSGMLAAGVKSVDHSLKGDDYLNQFGPEIKDAVKSYINGDVMPTGNPRAATIASNAKTIAQKYGADKGIEVSDAIYNEKRKMRTDLASSGNSSMGGIISNGKSAFEHLANLGDKFTDLGNYNGPDVPGGAHVGTVGNIIGNVIAPTAVTKGKVGAVDQNALRYGQESTKFYAGSGGGEAERLSALKAVSGRSATGEEQAQYLQTEKELMLGRLRQKEDQIKNTMGADYLAKHPEYTTADPQLQKFIERTDAAIAKLKGRAPAQSGAAATPAAKAPANTTKSGVTWSVE